MEELYPNYLWRVPFTNDIDSWLQIWPSLEQQILEQTQGKHPFKVFSPRTTGLYYAYNIFTFDEPVIQELHQSLKKFINDLEPGKSYRIRGWLNVIRNQEVLNWHGHMPKAPGSLHGYLSINSEPGITAYRIGKDLVNVKNINGQIVIGYSHNDQHRTTPMPGDVPRVSLAFDIVPEEFNRFETANQWVPL